MTDTTEKQRRLPEIDLTPRQLGMAGAAVALVVMITGSWAVYRTPGPLPPPRPAPPQPARPVVTEFRYKVGYYRALLDEDATRTGSPRVTLERMLAGLPYRRELDAPVTLRAGKPIETESLRLSARVKKVWVGESGRGFRAKHLMLRISNLTDHPVAYRVRTRARGRCSGMGLVPHNAIALPAGGQVVRTECLASRRRPSLRVLSVEVLDLTPLGYHYVSRLDPEAIGLDPRTAAGHEPGRLGPCKALPWRRIQQALRERRARWVDVLDFYARHSCDEYNVYVGYRWSRRGPGKLPARPPATP